MPGRKKHQDKDGPTTTVGAAEVSVRCDKTGACVPQKAEKSHFEQASDPAYALEKAHGEIASLREEVARLTAERELQFDSQAKRVAAVRLIARLENTAQYAECDSLLARGKERRDVDKVLEIPFGQRLKTHTTL